MKNLTSSYLQPIIRKWKGKEQRTDPWWALIRGCTEKAGGGAALASLFSPQHPWDGWKTYRWWNRSSYTVSGRFWAWIFSSVQFSHSVVSDSLRPHESQHARPPCPSPTPGVHSDSRPSSQWCHPAISSSVVPFSSCPQPSQHQSLFQWVNSSHEVAKVQEFQL